MKEAMQMKLGKRGEYKLYTVLFVLPMVLILFIFALGGNSFVWSADGLNQYYPVLEYIRRYLRETISSGKIQQFDLTIGLGEGIIPVLNYYGFGNPFTLFLIFVPEGGTAWFLTVLVFIHLFLAGVSFLFFCSHSGYTNKYIIVAAALMYSFSTFALIQGFEFWTFLTPSVSLPLIVAGIQSIVDGKKDMACRFALIGGIFFQALNGFYFLYEIAIFGFSFFLIYNIGKKSIRKWLKTGSSILGLCLLGVCMAGIIFVPAILGFLQSSRNGGSGGIELLYAWDEYVVFLKNLFIPRAFESGLGMAIPFVLAFILLWGCRQVAFRVKILAIFWGICYLTPLSGTVMNGFSYTTTRWQFILVFIAALIFVEVFDAPQIEEKKIVWCLYILLIGVSICFHIADMEKNVAGVFRGGCYLALAVFPVVVWKKRNEGTILLFCLGTLCLNICMIFGPVALGGSGFRAGFLTYEELEGMEEDSIGNDAQRGQEVYRLDAWDFSLGASLILDYYGTAEYFSIENGAVSEFYREFLISPGMVSTWTLYGIDGRNVIEDLLSVQYFTENRKGENGYEKVVLENEDVRPIGIFFDSYLPREDFVNLDPINRMTAVARHVVLDKEATGVEMRKAQEFSEDYAVPFTVEYQNIKQEDGFLYVNEDSRIYIYPDIAEGTEGEVYVFFKNLKRYASPGRELNLSRIQVGNRQIQVLDAEYSSEAGINIWDYLIHTNYGVEVPDVIEISFEEEDKLEIGQIDVYLYSPEPLTSEVDMVEVELEEKNGDISGIVQADRDGLIFLSIPYSSGWTATIDGEKVELLKADVSFMALPVTEGNHTFSLKYSTPGLRLGIAASLLGFSGCICYYFGVKRKQKNSDSDRMGISLYE